MRTFADIFILLAFQKWSLVSGFRTRVVRWWKEKEIDDKKEKQQKIDEKMWVVGR